MNSIVTQLFNVFSPIVLDLIAQHRAANNGAVPTEAEIQAAFAANVDKYLGEGAAWKASHPHA